MAGTRHYKAVPPSLRAADIRHCERAAYGRQREAISSYARIASWARRRVEIAMTVGRGNLLLAVMLLVSCASVRDIRYPVHVTNTRVIDLMAPTDIASPVDALFSLTMTAGDNSFSAMTYLTADDTGVYAALMNDFGMDMANLSYDGENLTFDSDVMTKSIPPQYIVADLQFALYSEDAVRAALEAAGLTLETAAGKRTILKGKKIIEEIETADGNITVHNLLRGYQLSATEAPQ